MKVSVLIALLLPIAALAQRPQSLEWTPTAQVTARINAGWKFGTVDGKCLAIDPKKKQHTFPPRKDGKCYVQDAK